MTVNDLGSPPNLSAQVAEEIRALLARRRISGRELARRMGASHAWVNFRLTGAQTITLDDLQRFAAVLNVDALDLMPARREGRIITAVGSDREPEVSVKSHKPSVAKQSPVVGYPNRTIANLSTRRPGRILQTAAA